MFLNVKQNNHIGMRIETRGKVHISQLHTHYAIEKELYFLINLGG